MLFIQYFRVFRCQTEKNVYLNACLAEQGWLLHEAKEGKKRKKERKN